MSQKSTQYKEKPLKQAILQGMQDKKAQDICLLDLRAIRHAVAEYFVVCSADTFRQVEAVADAVVATSYEQTGEKPWKQEGWTAKEWILIDYVDVVVHIFQTEKRAWYALEALWGDADCTYVDQ